MSACIIPSMHYKDPEAMLTWLEGAFGFVPHFVARDDGGLIVHAQLTYGNSMVMIGPDNHSGEFGGLLALPQKMGSTTQCPYIIVDDIDALYARAQAAGAEIIVPLHDEDYGGQGFGCYDPERHLWYFGTFNPWTD